MQLRSFFHNKTYPKTDNVLLLQYVISDKVEVNKKYDPILIDPVAIVESDYSAYKYTSPDESRSVYITQETYAADFSETKVYYVNNDNSYSFAADIPTSKGYAPFDDKGKWLKDEAGNDVFSNGESYKMIWLDDRVIIDYISDYEKWVTQVIEFK